MGRLPAIAMGSSAPWATRAAAAAARARNSSRRFEVMDVRLTNRVGRGKLVPHILGQPCNRRRPGVACEDQRVDVLGDSPMTVDSAREAFRDGVIRLGSVPHNFSEPDEAE